MRTPEKLGWRFNEENLLFLFLTEIIEHESYNLSFGMLRSVGATSYVFLEVAHYREAEAEYDCMR